MARYPGRRAPSAQLALGWYVSRFQRCCRFAAGASGAFASAWGSTAELFITPMKPAAAKVGGNQGPMAGRRLAVCFRHIIPGVFPNEVVTPMKPAAVKVSGNQGRMAGRRLAVGFRHIVPGVFPNEVYTDRVPFRVVGQSLIRRYCQRRSPTHKRDMTQVQYRSPPR